jgi:cytochrome P450
MDTVIGATIGEDARNEAEAIVASLMDGTMQPDPYPLYHRLRELAPVFYSEKLRMWFVSSYKGNFDLHGDLLVGQGDRSAQLLNHPVYGNSPVMRYVATFLVGIDPPDHSRMRKFIAPAFSPGRIAKLEATIQNVIDELLDAVEKKNNPDLHRDYSALIPMTIICKMLGVPEAQYAQGIRWSNAIAAIVIVPQPTAEQIRPADEAFAAASTFFSELIEERRVRPRDDLLSMLITAEEDGEHLSTYEVITLAIQLMVAGSETTTTTIEQGINILLHHPEQLCQLREDTSLDKNAVEELLRYDAPLHVSLYRTALQDTVISGVRIRAGEMILPLIAAGNRDPMQFEHPDTLNLRRTGAGRMLSFGRGMHICVGMWLARMEARIAICTIIRRFPHLRLTAEPKLRGAPASRGLENLPVALS